MAGIRIEGNTSGNVAEVDAGNNLTVTLPTTDSRTGKARFMSENDSGSVTGSVLLMSPETEDDYRLRIGQDTVLDEDVFNYAAQNTGRHVYANTTMTNAWSGGFLTTNSGSITTNTTGTSFFSRRQFPIFGSSPTYAEFSLALSAALATNTTIDFGLFAANGANPYNPTDGVYFRVTSAGFFGVTNNGGSEQVSGAFSFTHTNNTVYKFVITCSQRIVRFWINDVLYASLTAPAALGSVFLTGAAPVAIRHAIAGGAAGSTLQAKLASYTVSMGGWHSAKPWAHQLNGAGRMPYQGLSGGTMGTTANYANSANPTSAGGSNTAANVTGLGGQSAINAALGAATDYIATSYQVPAGSTAQAPRNLYITGVRISSINMGAAVATTPTTLVWSLAFGHTSVSMATAEAATAKAPRRVVLGAQSAAVGAAIGAVYAPDIYMPFSSPIVVHPGEFIATVMKQVVGTATGSQSIWSYVTFDGYFE
jgi:hypothetical protein